MKKTAAPFSPQASTHRSPHVLMAGKLTALNSPGGGEIQMTATASALEAIGVSARPWRPWEERLADADLLHLFGSAAEHLPVVEAARREDIPVVLSTIAWFDLASYWALPRNVLGRIVASGRFLMRACCPKLPSWRRRLYQQVDLLLPNSNAEAQQLTRYFGVPSRRIHVVPNGTDPRFACADPEPFAQRVGVRKFVLCAGRIEPRKNQLGLLRAMRGTGVPVVVLGDVVPGDETYAIACRRVADKHVRFVGRLDHDDPMLASAYAACGCLVLCGQFETPGLAALEAGASGTPLVLPRRGACEEYFGPHAQYVRSGNLREIRDAVLASLACGHHEELAEHVRKNFSWEKSAQITQIAYSKVL